MTIYEVMIIAIITLSIGVAIGWAIWSPYKKQCEVYKKEAKRNWETYLDLLDKILAKDISIIDL